MTGKTHRGDADEVFNVNNVNNTLAPSHHHSIMFLSTRYNQKLSAGRYA